MTAPAFPDGIDAAVWEEVRALNTALGVLARDDQVVTIQQGNNAARYFVRREPTPTMPVLPTEPGAVIRATIDDRSWNIVRDGIDGNWHFCTTHEIVPTKEITAWTPLLTPSETAEAFGVEELREAWKHWRDGNSDSDFDEEVDKFLARVDEAVQG